MEPDLRAHNERCRQFPGGDSWANEHRWQLGGNVYMQDLDAVLGGALFCEPTGEQLFCEFATDVIANRNLAVREFALVALFDRKQTHTAVLGHFNSLRGQFNRWLCRCLGRFQPHPPRFFYIVGTQAPWTMIEVDIVSGALAETWWSYGPGEWRLTWERAGLTGLRDTLTHFLRREQP